MGHHKKAVAFSLPQTAQLARFNSSPCMRLTALLLMPLAVAVPTVALVVVTLAVGANSDTSINSASASFAAHWPWHAIAQPVGVLLISLCTVTCSATVFDFRLSRAAQAIAATVATIASVALTLAPAALLGAWPLPWGHAMQLVLAVGFSLVAVRVPLARHDRRSRTTAASCRFAAWTLLAALGWALLAAATALVSPAALGHVAGVLSWLGHGSAAFCQVLLFGLAMPAFQTWVKHRADATVAEGNPDAACVVATLMDHIAALCRLCLLPYLLPGATPFLAMLLGEAGRQTYEAMAITGHTKRLSNILSSATASLRARLRRHCALAKRCCQSLLCYCRRRSSRAAGLPGGMASVLPAAGTHHGHMHHHHHNHRNAHLHGMQSHGMAEEQDDGQAHIEPKKFKLMCMLYDQKVPKVFAQYDQPTIHREHIRQTMLLVLAQHANVAALWQLTALLLAAAATGVLPWFSLGDVALVQSQAGLPAAKVRAHHAAWTAQGPAAMDPWLSPVQQLQLLLAGGLLWRVVLLAVTQLALVVASRAWLARRLKLHVLHQLAFVQGRYRGVLAAMQAATCVAVLGSACWLSGNDTTWQFAWLKS